jgi:uracil-DNA glycosylase family 4
MGDTLQKLNKAIIACRKCPRLVRYRERVASERRRAYQECTYWGKPVPGFGDPHARLLILGLAPAAHGANRTGRMFTGDRSGDFLYKGLYGAGFASQATSVGLKDGLKLTDTYITATLRCAPPANKPLLSETAHCLPFLERELELIEPRAVLALGFIATRAYLTLLRKHGKLLKPSLKFRHGVSYELGPGLPRLFLSYHPSQQNTFTGKLTEAMLRSVLDDIRQFLKEDALR